MTALPLEAPFLKLASDSVPAPLRRLLREARLAEPPGSVSDVHFDRTAGAPGTGAEKTLLSFRATRGEINLFVLLSPALRETIPSRLDEIGSPERDHAGLTIEPSHPRWGPDRDDPGRRYAYRTARFDAVDVIIDDLTGTVSVRAVRRA